VHGLLDPAYVKTELPAMREVASSPIIVIK